MKKLIISLLFFFPFISWAQNNEKPDVSESYNVIIDPLGVDNSCATYRVDVIYNGIKSYGLSHITIGVPCGEIYNVHNSRGFDQEVPYKNKETGEYGIKIDNIDNFGEHENIQETLSVFFTVCTREDFCKDSVSTIIVKLKAGTQIDSNSVVVPWIINTDTVKTPIDWDTVNPNDSSDNEFNKPLPNIIYIPTVFNPESTNFDNRYVMVYGNNISPENFLFRIFNRWGIVVYSTNSLYIANTVGWDGKYKNQPQSIGVFTYIVTGRFMDDEPIKKVGTITLIK